ncbi:MAG: PD-(D/E)XK nuclease family protein, partial [Candidatus Latescibacterota bacterium]
PYDLSGGGPVTEVPEVRALIDLLQAVHRPDHPLPLLSFLRGLLVGMGDDELYAFSRAGGAFDYRRPLPAATPAVLRERFGQAFGCLRTADDRLRHHSPAVAIQGIVEELGLIPFAASGGLGSSRAGSLVRLLALVRQGESDGLHWGRIVEALGRMVADPEGAAEQMTLETGRQDVVRLMNLHQAKGLQARVVFLADPMDTVVERQAPDFHVARQGPSGFLSLPVCRPRGEHGHEVIAEPAGWEEDAAEEARYLEAESLRLLYVAATRARNLLIISCYEGKRESGSWAPLYPHLAEVPELEEVEEPAARTPEPLPDWEEQMRVTASARESIGPATVAVRAVTEALPEEEDGWGSERPGHGRDYGTLVHLLLQAAVEQTLPADEAAAIRVLVARAELPAELADSAQAALTAFRASPLWSEIEAAATVYTEVPLAAPAELVPGLALPAGDLPTVLRGQADLLYRVPGGWKLVDYKTEGTPTDAPRHAVQLEAYADLWQAITSEPVKARGIWLTDPGIWVPL